MKYNFYRIINKVNGKCYVGMTKRDVKVRFDEHIRSANTNHDLNNDYVMPIYNAMRKYGIDLFDVEHIDSRDLESYKDAEIYEGRLIAEYDSLLSQKGYNLNKMNEDGSRTYEPEIRTKIVEINIGTNNPFYGKKHKYETRHKISVKAKERLADPKNNPRYGYKYTEEDKARHRESKKKFGKAFYADGVLYQTLGEAARKYNLTKQAIKHRIDSDSFKNWYYEKNHG